MCENIRVPPPPGIGLSSMFIKIFSALLLNRDSSFTQAKKPPCELNTLCVLTTAATRAQMYLSKKDAKDQQTMQSSTTPDPVYYTGK